MKLIWYSLSQSGRKIQIHPSDEKKFTSKLKTAMEQFSSSNSLIEPHILIELLVKEFMVETPQKVMGQHREGSEFFDALAGKMNPQIQPCLSFAFMQPVVEWVQICVPCICRDKSKNEIKRDAFIDVYWPMEGAESASLQQLVEYRLNANYNLHTTCDDCDKSSDWTEKLTLMTGIEALPIRVQRVKNHTMELGENLSINTKNNEIVHYELVGGVQNIGNFHYVVHLKNQDTFFRGSDSGEYTLSNINDVKKCEIFLYSKVDNANPMQAKPKSISEILQEKVKPITELLEEIAMHEPVERAPRRKAKKQ